jgi:acyl-CoA synthetase (NDP forming)
MPVLTIHVGRSAAGQKAAASHTAAAPPPMISRTALFEQAGIIATPSLGELLDTAALLATQPTPAGRNVAVVSNVGGAGVLTADACVESGLTVHTPTAETRRRLHALVPAAGSVSGPVDTTAVISHDDFRRCLELLAADEGVDAVLALVLPTAATGDLTAAIRAADVRVPLVSVVLDQMESLRLLPRGDEQGRPAHEAPAAGQGGSIPAYGYPEAAAAALARAAAYGEWKARPEGRIPDLAGVRAAEARALVTRFLAGLPDGGWLPPAEVAQLLACYGVPVAGPEAGGGTELMIGVVQEPVFGPLVVLGRGGQPVQVPGEQVARLAPLTDTDADELIRSVRPAPHQPALREMLLRVSRLADDLPEVAGLDLDPVIACPDGAFARNARIRLAPSPPEDPFLRKLR